MAWYSKLTEGDIEALKTNTTPNFLLDREFFEKLVLVPQIYRQWANLNYGWQPSIMDHLDSTSSHVYRLDPRWNEDNDIATDEETEYTKIGRFLEYLQKPNVIITIEIDSVVVEIHDENSYEEIRGFDLLPTLQEAVESYKTLTEEES